MKDLVKIILILFLLSGCSYNTGNYIKNIGCPDGEIEWINAVMINDIKFENNYFPNPADEPIPLVMEKGNEIGKVTYRMAGSACSNHRMKNGDATFLEEGTPIFEIKGYPPSFVVLADNEPFVVSQNKYAKKASELLPLDSLVKNIYFESLEDGSRIHTISQDSKDKFINSWYELQLEDVEGLINEGKLEGTRVFLEFELNNGITFRMLYWADSNTFHSGVIGNDEIKDIIDDELSKVIY